MKKHQKHNKLTRRQNGNFAPFEVTFLGAPCSYIDNVVMELSSVLSSKFKVAYLDASHKEDASTTHFDSYIYNENSDLNILKKSTLNPYQTKIDFSDIDICFINGNHFEGQNQIIILDQNKQKSIEKRIAQIDNVIAFIEKDKIDIFQVIKDQFSNYNDIPLFKLDENISELANLIQEKLNIQKPVLKGLVLAGGKSERMGEDKSKLKYFGKEHSLYLKELLEENELETFLSKTKNENSEIGIIEDTFLDLGPFGAICSAFRHNPNAAYLVLATDLPYIDSELINNLIQERDTSKIATAVIGEGQEFPEPLICIWEPKSYPVLLNYLSQGFSCPRKVLINSEIKKVSVDEKFITNINYKEDYLQILKNIV